MARIGAPGLTVSDRAPCGQSTRCPTLQHTGLMRADLSSAPPSRAPLAHGRLPGALLGPRPSQRYLPRFTFRPRVPPPRAQAPPAPRSQRPHVHSLAPCWPLPTPSGTGVPRARGLCCCPARVLVVFAPDASPRSGTKLDLGGHSGDPANGRSWDQSKPSLWVRDHIPLLLPEATDPLSGASGVQSPGSRGGSACPRGQPLGPPALCLACPHCVPRSFLRSPWDTPPRLGPL